MVSVERIRELREQRHEALPYDLKYYLYIKGLRNSFQNKGYKMDISSDESPDREHLSLEEYIKLCRGCVMDGDYKAALAYLDEMEEGEWVIMEEKNKEGPVDSY